MRLIVFFDLPTKTKKEKRYYVRFRKFLLSDGYDMLQYSVYARLCFGIENIEKHLNRLKQNLPPEGSIRSLNLTDKQYSRMKHWLGAPSIKEKKVTAEQLILL